MEARRFYVVRGAAKHGTVTYNCPTIEWALRKLRDSTTAQCKDITVTEPNGLPLTEADLIGFIEGSGAAPSEETILAAPQVTRQPAWA